MSQSRVTETRIGFESVDRKHTDSEKFMQTVDTRIFDPENSIHKPEIYSVREDLQTPTVFAKTMRFATYRVESRCSPNPQLFSAHFPKSWEFRVSTAHQTRL